MADAAEVERFNIIDHIKHERMPSRLCPGAEQIKPVLVCPGCQKRSPIPKYNAAFHCDCGLSMQINGASLEVWKTKVPA